MQRRIQAAVFLAVVLGTASAFAARKGLIEVQVGNQKHRGKVVAFDSSRFWLLERDGQLKHLSMDGVSRFRSVSPVFRGLSAAEIRNGLRKEFGRDYEVAGSTYYLVVAPKGRARNYVALFDDVYRKFTSYFSSRGFDLERPPFPMVAVVFGSRNEFAQYMKRDGVNFGFSAAGYYHRQTNRVALFDPAGASGGAQLSNIRREAGKPSESLRDVIIHEATHQAAFNTGLHSRTGSTPKWVIEGLATVFEAPGIRNRTGQRGAKSRINAGRLRAFLAYHKKSRSTRSLAGFLASDRAFRVAGYGYAKAWALSFFLIERKSREYTRYIRLLTERDPMKPYKPRDRIADFQKAFGTDLDELEVEFVRFIESLE